MNELFRKEVIEAQSTRHMGAIMIARRTKSAAVAILALAAAIGIMLLGVFGEYTRRTTVVGQILPSEGMVTVVAPSSGVVTRIDLSEGGSVSEGDVGLRIDLPRATAMEGLDIRVSRSIEERSAAVVASYAAQLEQSKERTKGAVNQLIAAQSELRQLRAEIETRSRQLSLAEQQQERLQALGRDRFVSEVQIRAAESQFLDQKSALQAARRAVSAAERLVAQLQQQSNEGPSQIAGIESARDRDLATLGQERAESRAQGAMEVESPIAGMVAAVMVSNGQHVQTGQALATLLPLGGRLEAHLLIPTRAIGFVSTGDAVRLRYHAFPYQKFGHGNGKIVRVSRSALSPAEISALTGTSQIREPMYRVIVELEKESVSAFGNEEPLRPGMVLDADILGEQRALWEWVLEPLIAAARRTT